MALQRGISWSPGSGSAALRALRSPGNCSGTGIPNLSGPPSALGDHLAPQLEHLALFERSGQAEVLSGPVGPPSRCRASRISSTNISSSRSVLSRTMKVVVARELAMPAMAHKGRV